MNGATQKHTLTVDHSDGKLQVASTREKPERPSAISPLLRIVAMIMIAAVICTAFVLVRGDRAAGLIYLFISVGGIGAICAVLFCGHDDL
ncbi:MAG: hypothetical protein FWG32_06060 [Oscillospiraceae bacterium]|nr:hypothetical protein [Oscillospiraceae bacterium]